MVLLQSSPGSRLSYQDYLEQLTYILFPKMADERAADPKPRVR